MTTAVAVEANPEVTFYSWLGVAGRAGEEHACPSSQKIYISGGRRKVGDDGAVVREPVVEAVFNKGICRTSDPEIVAGLRKMMKNHPGGISEDVEEFYAATMTPKQRAQRAVAQGQKVAEENEALIQENRRLRERLEAAGREEPARRKTA